MNSQLFLLCLLFLYFSVFLTLMIRSMVFGLKLKPKFIFFFFLINFFLIFLRINNLFERKVSFTVFLLISSFFSIFYLCFLSYIKLKKKPKYFAYFEIKIFQKFLRFFLELSTLLDIFLLTKFKNEKFLEWCRFFNSFLQKTKIETRVLQMVFIFFGLTVSAFLLDIQQKQIFSSLLFFVFFNLFFRLMNGFFYFFHFYLKFLLSFYLQTRLKNPDLNDNNFFYQKKWKVLFRNWYNRDLNQIQEISRFTLYRLLWTDLKRLDLLLKKIKETKNLIDIFFSFFFLLTSIEVFFGGLLAPILMDLKEFFYIYFFLSFIKLIESFRSDPEIREFTNFLFYFEWWLKNNNTGYRFYSSPLRPFYKSFTEKLRKR